MQPDLCQTCSETPKTGFLASGLISHCYVVGHVAITTLAGGILVISVTHLNLAVKMAGTMVVSLLTRSMKHFVKKMWCSVDISLQALY